MIPVPGYRRWYVSVRLDGDSPQGLFYMLIKSFARHMTEDLIASWSPDLGWEQPLPEAILEACKNSHWPAEPQDGLAEAILAVVLATDPAALFLAMEVMTA